jgi:hypothetical protein
LLSPQAWKKHFGLINKDKKLKPSEAKKASVALAKQLTQSDEKWTDGEAEAYLIARAWIELN